MRHHIVHSITPFFEIANSHHIQLSTHQENKASWSGCMPAIQATMQDIMESLRRLWIAKMLLVPMASVARKNGYLLVPSCIQRFTRTISKYMVNFDSSIKLSFATGVVCQLCTLCHNALFNTRLTGLILTTVTH